VLAALADAVVVVQAGHRSGALNAARSARRQGKALWVVPPAPWAKGFRGSRELLEEGALALTRSHLLLGSLGLSNQALPSFSGALGGADRPTAPHPFSSQEFAVLRVTSAVPAHADRISERAGLSPQATTAALLTLALENVVVEGPPGFFRRGNAHNR
jgi:DNA processing protein